MKEKVGVLLTKALLLLSRLLRWVVLNTLALNGRRLPPCLNLIGLLLLLVLSGPPGEVRFLSLPICFSFGRFGAEMILPAMKSLGFMPSLFS